MISLYNFFLVSSFCLLFLTVVIPNSLQSLTATCMFACSLFAFHFIKFNYQFNLILKLFFLNTFITVFYTLIGYNDGAPSEAVSQVFIIYVIPPFLWILISGAVAQAFKEGVLQKIFIIMTMLSTASVALFFYLYLNFGSDSVSFFKESANINLNDGYSGATMHVYGSLIFLSSGLFASPTIVKNLTFRSALLISISIAAITSGRSALILSIFVGLFLSVFVKPRQLATAKAINQSIRKRTVTILYITFILFFFIFLISYYSEVNLTVLLDNFIDKVFSGGGSERADQALALIRGTQDTLGLGAGHGIGVDYVRSDEYPWRYELVWLATLFRVGILGAFVYSIVFFYYIYSFILAWKKAGVTEFDIFLFAGFVAAFISSNTNPYIEAFCFQWMYIFPIVHLLMKKNIYPINKNTNGCS